MKARRYVEKRSRIESRGWNRGDATEGHSGDAAVEDKGEWWQEGRVCKGGWAGGMESDGKWMRRDKRGERRKTGGWEKREHLWDRKTRASKPLGAAKLHCNKDTFFFGLLPCICTRPTYTAYTPPTHRSPLALVSSPAVLPALGGRTLPAEWSPAISKASHWTHHPRQPPWGSVMFSSVVLQHSRVLNLGSVATLSTSPQ